MIIFKAKYEQAWNINDIKIVCSTEMEDWDFEILGTYGNNLDMLKICLRTVLLNPDKRYKLKFGEATVIPNNFDEEKDGIIDVNNLKVEKQCKYDHSKIVSFCLYGNKKIYIKGALKNLEQYTKQYPEVKCYFYVRSYDVSPSVIKEIRDAGGVVIECINMVDWYMMFTRFFPFENSENKFFLSRDCDCRLIHREVKAIEQWLESEKNFHIIRDHPWHNEMIMGGLWGAKNMSLEYLRLFIMQWCLQYLNMHEDKKKGPDQYFLNNLYRVVKSEVLSHDEFFTYESLSEIIDAPRNKYEYIGEAYDEKDDILEEELRDVIECNENDKVLKKK